MTERHFRNKMASKTSPNESPQKAEVQSQEWDSETCTDIAQQLVKKCLDHYEGSMNSNKQGPLGSLYTGALSARVYLRLRLAQYLKRLEEPPGAGQPPTKKTRRPDTNEIQSLIRTAAKIAEEAAEIELELSTKKSRIRVTLLEGPYVGAKCLLAALYKELGQKGRAMEEAQELLDFLREYATTLDTKECEVLYGRSGALQAIFFLRKELEDASLGSEVAVTLAQQIVTEGLQTANQSNTSLPLLWEWHGKQYLGAAHGVVGILHTLLCLSKSEFDQIPTSPEGEYNLTSLVKESIRALDSYCFPESGNLRSSMGSSSEDKLVHWCHGAPGHVLLLVKASEVFQDESFLQKTREIGNKVVWPRGLLRKGVGLCHGIAGNAYCLLALGRPNQNHGENDDAMVWMRQASYFAAFSLKNWSSLESIPDRPFSLFEGAGGLAMLIMDLGILTHKDNNQTHASLHETRFPLYDF